MESCQTTLLGFCLTRPPVESGLAIFGFSEFLTALALLVLVFTSSDFLYQFRISVAAIPVRSISFMATVLIGIGTLLTDLWFAERWYSLPFGVSRPVLQGIAKGFRGYEAKIFDHIAELMYDLLLSASAIRSSPDNAWSIHYRTLWTSFFAFRDKSKAGNVIRFKFSRLVFDEIKRLEDLPNYEGSRILGICLNVFGTDLPSREDRNRGDYALHKSVVSWAQRNYLRLREVHPPVADDCLMGSITFDPEGKRLVKTYAQGLSLQPSRTYLDLDGQNVA